MKALIISLCLIYSSAHAQLSGWAFLTEWPWFYSIDTDKWHFALPQDDGLWIATNNGGSTADWQIYNEDINYLVPSSVANETWQLGPSTVVFNDDNTCSLAGVTGFYTLQTVSTRQAILVITTGSGILSEYTLNFTSTDNASFQARTLTSNGVVDFTGSFTQQSN